MVWGIVKANREMKEVVLLHNPSGPYGVEAIRFFKTNVLPCRIV